MKNKINPLNILVIILFTLITFAVIIYASVILGIGEYYHPNSFEINYGLKYYTYFLGAIFINWIAAIAVSFVIKKRKIYAYYIAFLVLAGIIAAFFALNKVPTNNTINVYLGAEEYNIPLTYDPQPKILTPKYNTGKPIDYFSISVNSNFEPIYSSDDRYNDRSFTIYQDYSSFQRGFFQTYSLDDMHTVVSEDMRSKPISTEMRFIYKEEWSKVYYYQLDNSGKVIRWIKCWSHLEGCGYGFTDGKRFYSTRLEKVQIEDLQYRENLETKIIALFQNLR